MSSTMKKSRSKNEVKRQQILDAATVLFLEQGYALTSMDTVAKKAEVSKQTVYSHFGSKEELFAASIEKKCDSYQMTNIDLNDLSDPQDILLLLAERFLNMLTSKEALAVHKICSFESKTYPQLSELFYQAGPERLINEVEHLMTLFKENNILAINNPRYAALQFLNIMKGEVWMRVEFNTKIQLSKQEITAYLEDSVTLFLRGYALS